MTTPRLTVELVPSTCWFSNVRSAVSVGDWNKLKRLTATAAGNRCEICSGRGPRWPVECHEVWEYYDGHSEGPTIQAWGRQKLIRLIALCPACHEVKHLGLAEKNGRLEPALAHLAKVNGWSRDDAWLYAEACFEEWARRSTYKWELDLTWLDAQHIRHSNDRRVA